MQHPHRSRLIMPVTNQKFVQKAPIRNADIIVLDLEDSIPKSEKVNARSYLKSSVPIASQGGSAVYVRVNNEPDLLKDDIESAICKELTGIYVPKVETRAQVEEVDEFLLTLEKEHGLELHSIQLAILIESAKGFLNMEQIIQGSNRIQSLSIGVEDFVDDMQMTLSANTADVLKNIRMQICLVARAYDIVPMGLMSSISNYTDLEELSKSAKLAYDHGFAGNSCVHPSNVEILNSAFMPSLEEVEDAQNLIDAFEQALQIGKAAINYNGKMVDIPHYEKAKKLIDKYTFYKKWDEQKASAQLEYKSQLKEV